MADNRNHGRADQAQSSSGGQARHADQRSGKRDGTGEFGGYGGYVGEAQQGGTADKRASDRKLDEQRRQPDHRNESAQSGSSEGASGSGTAPADTSGSSQS